MIDEATLDACIRTMIALKAFVAIVLLAYWLDPKPPYCNNETFDVIELYAGRARITRIARAAGYMAVAADQKYDPDENSALNLNSSSGFVLAVLMVLSGSVEGAIAVLGIECSTFVEVNRGSSKRSELLPWGDEEVSSVYEANQATSRTMLWLHRMAFSDRVLL
ncbi:unnamed protein product [Symbiodinium sp. CCMP2592]|nr:unnamed protein product [Symbiodinium sp. CCMP2592]